MKRIDTVHNTPQRKYSNYKGYATRRMIMDWLMYHIRLSDTRSSDYPFRIWVYTQNWFPDADTRIVINFTTDTPWGAYEYATEKIFADKCLRKLFLQLYYS